MISLALGLFGLAAAAVTVSMGCFDRLIRYQYRSHHEDWLSCGKPVGFFFTPSGTTRWEGAWSTRRLHFRWIVLSPSWAREDKKIARALVVLRGAHALAAASLLGFIATLVANR